MQPSNSSLPDDVRAALESGKTIEAIQRLRQAQGIGLKEAKEIVEQSLRGEAVSIAVPESAPAAGGLPPEVLAALPAGQKIEAIKLLREKTGLSLAAAKAAVERAESPHALHSASKLSPGAVPKGIGLLGGLVLMLLAGLVYYLLTK